MLQYREATKSDQKAIVDLLTEAFFQYDYYKLYVKNEKQRWQFVRKIQDICVQTALIKKYLILLGVLNCRIVSVALLVPPRAEEISLMDYALNGGLSLFYYGGIKATFGFLGLFKAGNAVCQATYQDAWFLELLAVSEKNQGQGLGGQLLHDYVTPFIANQGGGLLTFITNSEENCRFYQKNGFTAFHKGLLHRNHQVLENWSFKKEIPSKSE